MDNCLGCVKYVKCTKKKKGRDYICKKFKPNGTSFAELFNPTTAKDNVDARDSNVQIYTGEEDISKKELGLIKMLDSVLDPENRVPYDLKIDDRDIKEFPNFFEFCTDSDGIGIEPYAKQLAIATILFAEYCPRCSSPDFSIERVPKKYNIYDFPDKVQFLEYGKCPKCKVGRSELVKKGELNFYQELVACIGQRSGKSALISGMLVPYLLHRYLKLQNPSEVFGLLKNSNMLTATLVALTFDKANSLLWLPIHQVIATSKWFVDYHSMLDFNSNRYGEELYKFNRTFIHYGHRNITVLPSGSNKRTLRGDTRFCSVIDELGWFFSDEKRGSKEKQDADGVYTALDRSLLTVRNSSKKLLAKGFNNIPNAYAFNISSPSSVRDKIMTLLRIHSGSKEVLTFHAPTWKFNPTLCRADFAKEFRENYGNAMRDYGAEPPRNENPFISDDQYIMKSVGQLKNRIDYRYKFSTNKSGTRQKYAELVTSRTGSTVLPSVMAMDAGVVNNSFSIVIGHHDRRDGKEVTVFDVMIEIAPDLRKNVLNYSKIASEILYPLIEIFNVRFVSADRWQSIKILSDIEEKYPHVATKIYSLKHVDMVHIRDYFVSDETTIYIPKMEMTLDEVDSIDHELYPHCFKYKPVAHFYYQCMTVTDDGRKVDKGLNLTDDLFRATFLALEFLLDDDFVAKQLTSTLVKRGSAGVGAAAGLSGSVFVNRPIEAIRGIPGKARTSSTVGTGSSKL